MKKLLLITLIVLTSCLQEFPEKSPANKADVNEKKFKYGIMINGVEKKCYNNLVLAENLNCGYSLNCEDGTNYSCATNVRLLE